MMNQTEQEKEQQEQQQEPRAFGYARMPRIIRKGFKNLSKLQKLLYIYLRDLCGEIGTCYRSVRTLAEETDFSTGYVSENIPKLRAAGLIVAEKLKRFERGWPVWHIRIVDIWPKNAAFLRGNCSPDEQNEQNSEENQGNHDQNRSRGEQNPPNGDETVHDVNTNCSPDEQNSQNRSQDEQNQQNCSHHPDLIRIITSENSFMNKNPVSEITASNDAHHSAPSLSHEKNDASFSSPPPPPAPVADTGKGEQGKQGRPGKQEREPTIKELFERLSPEMKALTQNAIHEWQSIFSYPIPVTDTTLKHGMTLAGFVPQPGEIAACRLWMYETDETNWYTKRGMHFGDVAREFERFRSLRAAPPRGTGSEPGQPKRYISSFDDPDYDVSGEFYPSEEEKKARRACETC